MILLAVSLVGGAGAASRFLLGGWATRRWSSELPVATITINVLGSLVIGVLAGALGSGSIPATTFTLLATGFCGGFTTFSTSMVETVRLAQDGAHRRAVLTAGATLAAAVGAVALGVGLGGLLP